LLQKERKSLTITIQFKLAKQESPRRFSGWIFLDLKRKGVPSSWFFFCAFFSFQVIFFLLRCNSKKIQRILMWKLKRKKKGREKSSNKKQKLKTWREKEIFWYFFSLNKIKRNVSNVDYSALAPPRYFFLKISWDVLFFNIFLSWIC